MAVVTPQSDVYLLKVPLEIDDMNQLTFANATAQYNYFNSLPKIGVTNFTYQRKDGTIRYGAHFDSLLNYNYVMYRNDAYSNKWFYAFITGMEYLNDNVTAISIKTDVWQTYQFDLTFKPVLIDREHTNNDAIGANTLDEGLELGEMVCNGDVSNFGVNITGVGDWVIVVDVSMIENPGDNQTLSCTGNPTGQYVNSTPSGLYHLILGVNQSVVVSARSIIDLYDQAGLSEAIQNVYILPRDLVGNVTAVTLSTQGSAPQPYQSVGVHMPNNSTGVTSLGTYSCARPNQIQSYYPKNNKLLTYPYNYLNVSNNAGSVYAYHYEEFDNGASFKVEGVMTPSGSTKAVPVNYKHITGNENAYDYSVSGAKYPICAWTTDSYTNWLTQNSVNMEHEMNKSIIMGGKNAIGAELALAALGVASGGLIAAAGLGLMGASIIGTALEQHRARSDANLVADQARGNINSGDIVWSKWKSQFTFIPMSIKREVAQCIDEFFSQYGYKCNRVKVPNITGRRNWNYVKTVGCYIEADIPQEDLQEIKSMFDKGITLWHNPATFADYSQTNDIV